MAFSHGSVRPEMNHDHLRWNRTFRRCDTRLGVLANCRDTVASTVPEPHSLLKFLLRAKHHRVAHGGDPTIVRSERAGHGVADDVANVVHRFDNDVIVAGVRGEHDRETTIAVDVDRFTVHDHRGPGSVVPVNSTE